MRGYAIAFLLLVASLFIGLGWYTLDSLQTAHAEIQQRNQQAAEQEIQLATERLISNLRELSTPFSHWDEVFQQLLNPAYYDNWRQHRLFNVRMLPDYVEAAEIFDQNGQSLGNSTDHQFPAQIEVEEFTAELDVQSEQASLFVYLPLSRRINNLQTIEGYIGLRLPFIPTLVDNYQFQYLRVSSLRIRPPAEPVINLLEVAPPIDYELLYNQDIEQMRQILNESSIRFASIIVVLCLFFYLMLVYLFGKPLVRISNYIDRLRASAPGSVSIKSDATLPVFEFEKIKQSLNQYHHQLQTAHGDLDEKNKELWKLAHHDALTGMLNRRAFETEWNEVKQLLANHRFGIGLILIDVNQFKAINDTYGHQVGDQVLIIISNCLQRTLRQKEKLYRIGGDEFAAIIVGSHEKDEVTLSERCIRAVEDYDFSSLGIKETVRISCGIAHCQADDLTRLENLESYADIAVYQAKRPGVTEPILFTDDMTEGAGSKFSSWLSNAVHEATVNGTGMQMYYQPIVKSKSQKIAYYEALVRLKHDGELIPPSHIFPIISQRHLATEFDRAVWQSVLQDLNDGYFDQGTGIAVNLSAESVGHNKLIDWLAPLAQHLQHYTILLEVTETALITQLAPAMDNLNRLRKLGFKVALDDFGSGYSSLRYLTGMPVDSIKFDISLTQGMNDERLYKLIVELSGILTDLGYDLVAEGIDSTQMLDMARQAGFKYAQGHLFGKPSRKAEPASAQGSATLSVSG